MEELEKWKETLAEEDKRACEANIAAELGRSVCA